MTDMHRGQWDAYARAVERLKKRKGPLGLVLALLLAILVATTSTVFSQVISDFWRQLTSAGPVVPPNPNDSSTIQELHQHGDTAKDERDAERRK